jgi:hypothetical protein
MGFTMTEDAQVAILKVPAVAQAPPTTANGSCGPAHGWLS